jgi:hypothetical protein
MTTANWYADGLRWIGSIFNDAAERLERNDAEPPLEPRAYRDIERYVDEMRARVHVHF